MGRRYVESEGKVNAEVFFIVKTYPNGKTRIEDGPYYSHMDALCAKEKNILPIYENDYVIAKTELVLEVA